MSISHHPIPEVKDRYPAIADDDTLDGTLLVDTLDDIPIETLESAPKSSPEVIEAVKMPRRNFLAAMAAVVTVGIAGEVPEFLGSRHDEYELESQTPDTHFNRQESDPEHLERELLKDDMGNEVWIVNNSHLFPIDMDGIPPDINGLFIDRGMKDYGMGPLTRLSTSPFDNYKPVNDFVKKNRTDIFDVDFVSAGQYLSEAIDKLIIGTEAVAGAPFAVESVRNRKVWKKEGGSLIERTILAIKRQFSFRRPKREFTKEKRSPAEKVIFAITGGYLLWPFINNIIARNASLATGLGEKATEQMNRSMHASRPEIGNLITHVRDIVIALKIQFILQKLYEESGGEEQHIVGFMGGNHMVSERLLKSPTENLNDLRAYLDILPHLDNHGAHTFHSVDHHKPFTDTSTHMQEFEVSDLKQLYDEVIRDSRTHADPQPQA
jgi:hypothetical protein